MKVEVGQIWQENDKRSERYVLVIAVDSTYAQIVKCSSDGEVLGTRATHATLTRFGKSGGYKFVKAHR